MVRPHHHATGHCLGFPFLISLQLPWERGTGRDSCCLTNPAPGAQPSSHKGLHGTSSHINS